jgi:hypothetical protein
MIAGIYNIFCEQGTTFTRILELEYPDDIDPTVFHKFDLTNFTARMQVRRTIDTPLPMIELTTENGSIEILDLDSRIIVRMTDEQTSSLTSSGVYDLEIISEDGIVSRVIQGNFTLSREVTR